MAYRPYATVADYEEIMGGEMGKIEDAELTRALRKASRHIDTLTFNRIVARGYDQLTDFQKEIIREVCCRLAHFEIENEDLISSILSGYSINGVSVQMTASITIFAESGIVMPKELYSTLIQTGLGCRGASAWVGW